MNKQTVMEVNVASQVARKRKAGLLILAAVSGCCVACIIAAYTLFMIRGFHDWESRSRFGNSWGGLTTVFSGLGLLGVSLALVLQTWELEAQTKAVEASLEEQAVTREMLARQTKALALGALAQVVSIQLEAKHRGFGSGELKLQMDTLERLAHGIRKELESDG
jgi:hypothetical protein